MDLVFNDILVEVDDSGAMVRSVYSHTGKEYPYHISQGSTITNAIGDAICKKYNILYFYREEQGISRICFRFKEIELNDMLNSGASFSSLLLMRDL